MSRPRPRRVVWLDGRVLPASRARVSVFDRGLLYGDAAFETVRVYRGKPFRWREHRKRLATTLKRLAIPFPRTDLRRAIDEVLEAARLTEAAVRLTITRGVGEGLAPSAKLDPTLLLIPRPVPAGLEDARINGVSVIRLPFGQGRHGFTTGHKTTDYAAAVQGRILAARADAFEALYVEEDGSLSEATTSNVFVVKRGRLLTPPVTAGCLPGITREVVLQIAEKEGLPTREQVLQAGPLEDADEIVLTGSVIEVMPVVRLDDSPVGTGAPGPVTTLLQRAFRRRVAAALK
ncbi:MAG: aminotransferase class IV [Candidatus Binatia bacterium]|nr:aminotransferase class IV [Candidatus Binatia bacterium]